MNTYLTAEAHPSSPRLRRTGSSQRNFFTAKAQRSQRKVWRGRDTSASVNSQFTTADRLVAHKPLDKCIFLSYTIYMDEHDPIFRCEGFEWDEHNAGKIFSKHGVLPLESEQLFFNRPLMVSDDEKHSQKERRFYALGRTDSGRMLFVVFTVRGVNIRVISARDMSMKERGVYLGYEKKNS